MKYVISVVWASSYGITSNSQIPLFFLSSTKNPAVNKISFYSQPKTDDLVIGWGNKPNTQKAIAFAAKHGLPYVRLEDGFISYLGHPSADKNRLSLIKDDLGIYYDARSESRLERLCIKQPSSINDKNLARAKLLIQRITALGLSKYNHGRSALPHWLDELADDCILLVDQTAGDQSIESGLASSESFQQMLVSARDKHPDKSIIIKTHPDVILGKKKGHFAADNLLDDNVFLLGDDCNLALLFDKVAQVYTVTSQVGFEALLYGKPVHCFGMPFYAGWGLTIDRLVCARRNIQLTLPQLVCASVIQYPTYLNPENNQLCEVEEIIDWLEVQLKGRGQGNAIEVCYAFGFSLWKRAFVRQFIGAMARQVEFINDAAELEKRISVSGKNTAVLLWGRAKADWAQVLRQHAQVWFMEDGFLRSVGLGADLRRPSCLVIDRQGMYYDSSENSDVIDILNAIQLTELQTQRADRLIENIKQQRVTKYNVGTKKNVATLLAELRLLAAGRDIIVVPGQFENDLSIACSLGKIKTNLALLTQVRADFPDSFIIFKEHPDVYSGVRPGALGSSKALVAADLYLADIDMDSLLSCCDRICTLTSLAGFEALLRGKSVSIYGSPFYAGWGLTDDKIVFPNRHARLTLSALVYGAMIEYSRYVDWDTGYLTGPERTVSFLAQQRENHKNEVLKSSWLSRQLRKIRYFLDSIL